MSTDELTVHFMSRLSDKIKNNDTETIVSALLNLTISIVMARGDLNESQAIVLIRNRLTTADQDNEPCKPANIKALLKSHRSDKIDVADARSAILQHFGPFQNTRAEQSARQYVDNMLREVKSGNLSVERASLSLEESASASQP